METVSRMDCPSPMREHLWSAPRDGAVECLWCYGRRPAEDAVRPGVGGGPAPQPGGPPVSPGDSRGMVGQ
jgi:hypothetical protein